MKRVNATGVRDALIFHALFFAIAIPVALSTEGNTLGVALVVFAIAYNMALPLIGKWRAHDVLQVQGFAIYPLIPEMLLAIGALWLWNTLKNKPYKQQFLGALALAVFYAGALSLSLLWIG